LNVIEGRGEERERNPQCYSMKKQLSLFYLTLQKEKENI